jgi:hypothetical protein
MPLVGIGTPPQPPPRRLVCHLPPVSGGRGTLAGEKGVGRVPIPTRGMYVLCAFPSSLKSFNTAKIPAILMRLSLYSVDPPEPDGESVCVDPLTGKTLAPLVQRMADMGQS